MKQSIGITGDLVDVFFIQALQEGYCNYMTIMDQKGRNSEAEYIKYKANLSEEVYEDKFDRLTQLLVLYDKISFPIFNQGFSLLGEMKQSMELCRVMPNSFYTDEQLDRGELSDEQAMLWKPILMSAINNINFSEYYINFAKESFLYTLIRSCG